MSGIASLFVGVQAFEDCHSCCTDIQVVSLYMYVIVTVPCLYIQTKHIVPYEVSKSLVPWL